jgi:hypothetical protein
MVSNKNYRIWSSRIWRGQRAICTSPLDNHTDFKRDKSNLYAIDLDLYTAILGNYCRYFWESKIKSGGGTQNDTKVKLKERKRLSVYKKR